MSYINHSPCRWSAHSPLPPTYLCCTTPRRQISCSCIFWIVTLTSWTATLISRVNKSPCHAPVRTPLFLITVLWVKVLTIREEEVGGSEIYILAAFQPGMSSVENPVLPVSQASTVTDQDTDNRAQPAISQAEGVTSISSRCCIPEKAIRSFTLSRRAWGKRHPDH